MIPVVYKSTDSNAPVLSGTKGSLINLLTKCLVEGYGDKAPAGWTREYANVALTIAAFRNNSTTGNGVFLRVDEATPAALQVYLQGFEVMTDENTGTGNFYDTATSTLITKSTTADATPRAWVLIASDKTLYLFVFSEVSAFTGYPNGVVVAFGDFVKLSDEGFNSLIGNGNGDWDNLRGMLAMQGVASSGTGYIRCSRNIAGAATPNSLWMGACAIVTANGGQMGTYGSVFDGQRLFLARPLLGDSGSLAIRGYLPGYFLPWHMYHSFSLLQEVTVEGRTFLNIKFCHKFTASTAVGADSLNYNIMIETGADWDAV